MHPGKAPQLTRCSTCPTSMTVMDSDTFRTDLLEPGVVTGINSRVGHDPIREVIEGEIVRKTPVWGTPSGARL